MKPAEQIIISRYGECRCAPIYKNRGKADPDCFLCEHGSEVSDMMNIYAAEIWGEIKAELDKVSKERDEYRNRLATIGITHPHLGG